MKILLRKYLTVTAVLFVTISLPEEASFSGDFHDHHKNLKKKY